MNQYDPLEEWLFIKSLDGPPSERITQVKQDLRAGLDELTAFLDDPPAKRADMSDAGRQLHWLTGSLIGFSPEDLPLAHEAYRRVFERGGTGTTHTQETLLTLIAAATDSTSIPFWLDVLNLSKQRDAFRHQRRTMALAALALMAAIGHKTAAFQALQQAIHHQDPEVRALAIYYLGRAYEAAERPWPTEMVDELSAVAAQDSFFEPRFQARTALQKAEQPVPLDNPGGVYTFKVKFMHNKRIYRVIELRSEQTLEDLQGAIQLAINWDNDHLYSFYMNGQKYDERYSFACPYEEDRPPWTIEAVVGQLGFVKRHKFLYHFDYGDDHLFEIEVVDIRPEAGSGPYPIVVERRGKAPAQYYWPDGDEW